MLTMKLNLCQFRVCNIRVACRASSSRRGVYLKKRDVLVTLPLVALNIVTQIAALADESSPKRSCTFSLSVDRQPFGGPVTVELFDPASTGARRFLDLCAGKEGVSYQRSKFDALFEGHYVHNAGVQSLSYNASGTTSIAGGDSTAQLERELQNSERSHDRGGIVSIQVKSMEEQVETTRLVAERGKLVTISEPSGVAQNGTAFAITVGPATELDRINLIVGHVTEGFDTLLRVSRLPVVKDNSSSPFFKAGQALGDKRANVAKLAFNRPFNKIVIASADAGM